MRAGKWLHYGHGRSWRSPGLTSLRSEDATPIAFDLKYKNAGCRILLVEKTDRLYRNFRDWVTLDEIKGLEVHFVKEGAVISDESRSPEKFIHGIEVLMAKNFIDNLILRNRVYSGEFDWRGERYAAVFESIVSRDLWLAAQAALDRRLGKRANKTGHCFPFSACFSAASAASRWWARSRKRSMCITTVPARAGGA